ncbi:hypothetical protein ABZ370_02270 [Streptomyces sp. NPDC005962]|uniref:hypothetical protein n=1 Tax=Streptomyces sp. NPDC005962 TaxID=3154466 RepID=UPI0033FE3C3C
MTSSESATASTAGISSAPHRGSRFGSLRRHGGGDDGSDGDGDGDVDVDGGAAGGVGAAAVTEVRPPPGGW